MNRQNRIAVQPNILKWARGRAEITIEALEKKFPKIIEWENGSLQPTLKQLESFAKTVHAPIGYLFLSEPPKETLPIPDFRTMGDHSISHPSPNLLQTLYLCQERQDWYRDYARIYGHTPLDYIGKAVIADDPIQTATIIRNTFKISIEDRKQLPSWTEALRHLIIRTEAMGVLVMASSIVGSNSHRKLMVEEFRGFALADNLAPLVFLNASDSKAAQMFTLAHEIAHLWLGESGISNSEVCVLPEQKIERWCNAVAAEVLLPLDMLQNAYQPGNEIEIEIQRLARLFKVSSLVTLRRLFDAGFINRDQLWMLYKDELERIRKLEKQKSSGGDFYRTLGTRTSKRFTRAVLANTLEGQTLFQDASRMLGFRKNATFYKAARELGVIV